MVGLALVLLVALVVALGLILLLLVVWEPLGKAGTEDSRKPLEQTSCLVVVVALLMLAATRQVRRRGAVGLPEPQGGLERYFSSIRTQPKPTAVGVAVQG